MKKTIAWHKECLENQRAHNARIIEHIEQLKRDYARGHNGIIEYDAQIIRAEEMGVTEFDREKFGKKRTDAAKSPQEKT